MTDRQHDVPEISPTMAAVGAAVGAPEVVLPWLDRFYDADDAELLLALAAAAPDAPAAPAATPAGGTDPEQARLARAVRRAVLDVDDAGAYSVASFHDRLEIWAMFEGWKDVPLAVRRGIADWDLAAYAEQIRPGLEAVRDGREGDQGDSTYVLLHEAEAIVAAQRHIYLFPCDCRAIVGRCRKQMDVCLRFENDRGLGWEISRERAVEILRKTDKAGLMHTADYAGDPTIAGAICNCCTDCCYPHLATGLVGTSDVWPVRRHVAAIDSDACKACGRCALRCPFHAITARHDGRPSLEPSLCRGCGRCATGCSADAIAMRPLAAG